MQSAAALLIAFPEHAHMRCRIQPADNDATFWTAEDLAVLFAGIYAEKIPCRAEVFTQASRALRLVSQDPSSVPFSSFRTPAERMTAAGDRVEDVIASLTMFGTDADAEFDTSAP
eukprot:2610607-Rhodomonas_salina.3